jgi:hypothetical protein
MRYINDVISEIDAGKISNYSAWKLLENNKVQNKLKELGYTWITFDTGYGTRMRNTSDLIIKDSDFSSEFYNIALETTPLKAFITKQSELSPLVTRRNKTLTVLNTLKKIPEMKEPTFTLAHMLAPHHPFVFDNNGNMPISDNEGLGSPKSVRKLYAEQMAYLDKMILRTVDSILARSEEPPIIIIQSDHGPYHFYIDPDPKIAKNQELSRMAIFNAYYLPGFDRKELYPEITPVNSFRLILNHYFGTSYKLLPDKSYYSDFETPEQNLVQVDPSVLYDAKY